MAEITEQDIQNYGDALNGAEEASAVIDKRIDEIYRIIFRIFKKVLKVQIKDRGGSFWSTRRVNWLRREERYHSERYCDTFLPRLLYKTIGLPIKLYGCSPDYGIPFRIKKYDFEKAVPRHYLFMKDKDIEAEVTAQVIKIKQRMEKEDEKQQTWQEERSQAKKKALNALTKDEQMVLGW